MARDFLCHPCPQTVANLQQVVHPGGMLVSINPERMLVQIDRNLGSNAEALSWAVQEALFLHDSLLDGVTRRMSQGVAIVDDDDAWQEDEGPPILQGLRRADRGRRGHRLCRLQYPPPPRLLGIRRRLFDLWMQRQGRRAKVIPLHPLSRSLPCRH